ncbi:MAG: lipid-A-disaccharide synthase [Proteobacteria bacterium]|nr:lipid-A-disaccharide synthase [Pseudomonadota bacterium]
MSKPLSIFAICGEFSGENHLARVVAKLKEFSDDVQITGMGSSLTKKAGMENFIDYKDYSFAGVVDVIFNLTKIFKLKKIILERIIALKPDIVLMVDYAGFNMQIAKGIRAAQLKDSSLQNIKLVQYIAPQLWASRPHRIKNIKKNIDIVLYTLPFEKEIYESVQQPAIYVGNPVLESLIEESTAECKAEIIDYLNLQKDHEAGENAEIEVPLHAPQIIGIFPGSRGFEVSYTLPLFIETAKILRFSYPDLKFIIARAPTISLEQLTQYGLKDVEGFVKVIDSESISNANQKLLKAADYLWLCSGTVTLEATLYEKPYFLTYKANPINFMLYKILRIIDMAGLANIIAGKFIVKEFLQKDARVENFLEETLMTVENDKYRDDLIKEFQIVKEKLGDYKSSELVARKLISLVSA